MKKMILALFAISSLAHANNKAIYGVDSRIDVEQSPNPIHKELAKSVAAMVPNYVINPNPSVFMDFFDITLQDSSSVCSNERFAHQQTVSVCTAFLVAPNVLATAGHCVRTVEDCENNKWVFDYKLENEEDSFVVNIPRSSVYSCKKVLDTKLTIFTKKDWALIELDRPVTDRAPLKLNKASPNKGDDVFVIGTPSGLPLKVASGSVRANKMNYFRTNLDTYAGNSGSPVFNKQNEVIGVLVRGDNDYDESVRGCNMSSRYGDSTGRGEDVSYVKDIIKALK